MDERDYKILSMLDKDSRMPINKIAKTLRLSKDGINYRLKKLEKEGIIQRYFIDIDVSKFGLILNKVTFKFQNTTKEKEKEIYNFLKGHHKIGWVALCSGAWDAIIVAYTKDLYEYNTLVKEIIRKYGKYIHMKEFVAHPDYYVSNRKWLAKKDNPIISHIGGPLQNKSPDLIDIKIIKALAKNARISLLEIAEITNLSSSAIIKRIKNLEKNKFILNYRIGLNLKKLEKEFCKSFIYLQNITKEKEDEIVNYCLNHTNVTALTHSIGPWDLELEMEVKNFDEFYEIMNEIKSKFKDIVKNYEAAVITKEEGIDYSNIL
ncbi:MAG: Lrp/AsnC family transcriptional regulator [Nanoarchaeota archaeon]|nr:Lrp/AsnC family transcriptional regulator [Nanoarchaeota archaeon]